MPAETYPEWYVKSSLSLPKTNSTRRERSRRHAQKRAKGRYQVDLTIEQVVAYSLRIETYQFGEDIKFLRKESNYITLYSIEYEEKTLIAVYSKRRHRIETFLPKEDKKEETK